MITQCDVCKANKNETNHWWKVWIDEEVFVACPTERYDEGRVSAGIVPFDVCGREHAITMFSRYIEYGEYGKVAQPQHSLEDMP